MNKKRIIIILFWLSISSYCEAQTALGHIIFVKTSNVNEFKITLFKSYDKNKAILNKTEAEKEDYNIEIPIKYYDDIWELLVNVNHVDIANRNVYCGDDSRFKISFGTANEVIFNVNCLTDRNSDKKLKKVIELFLNIKELYCR